MNEIRINKPKQSGISIYAGMILIDQGGFVCIVCKCMSNGECDVVRLEDGYAERASITRNRLVEEIGDGTYKIMSIGSTITLTAKGK